MLIKRDMQADFDESGKNIKNIIMMSRLRSSNAGTNLHFLTILSPKNSSSIYLNFKFSLRSDKAREITRAKKIPQTIRVKIDAHREIIGSSEFPSNTLISENHASMMN